VDVRSATVGGRHGTFEAESPCAIRTNAAASAWPVSGRSCLPEDDESARDRSAVRAEDASLKHVARTDLCPTRRGEATLLERTCAVTLGRLAGSGRPWSGERSACSDRGHHQARKHSAHRRRG
jgi:hypothetical protein